jgi:hypothetical protein
MKEYFFGAVSMTPIIFAENTLVGTLAHGIS